MMKNLVNASSTFVAVLLFATTSVSAQETVNNPDIVMDLKWEIGSWSDVWRIGQFESEAVGSDVSYYIYLPPGLSRHLLVSRRIWPALQCHAGRETA